MAQGLIEQENRICFKYDYTDEDRVKVYFPRKLDRGGFDPDIKNWDIEEFTKSEILEMLWTWDIVAPKTPSFDLLMNARVPTVGEKCEICPVGLMDEGARLIIAVEAMCEKYGTLPYDPGTSLESQPPWVVDSFLTISIAKDKYSTRKSELDRLKSQKGKK